jgi:malonate decarboxylase epsilon subunit
MHTAFLFPGQGAQSPHFLHALPQHEVVRATFAEAEQLLEVEVSALDTEAALRSTVAVQCGTLIAGVAYNRLLAAEDVLPDAVAGLSVGAFAAAVASGALRFADALRLVRLRSTAMEEGYGQGDRKSRLSAPRRQKRRRRLLTIGEAEYGMLAILGLREAAVEALIAGIASASVPLYLASVNGPAELVVAGSVVGLEAATHAAQRAGGRVRRLAVSVPSHGPLLNGVSARLREAMSEVPLVRPRVPYISNHRARALTDAENIAADLILNVSHTVRWHESITLLYELGCRLFIEAPPGRALSNLVKSEFPQARVLAGADVELSSVVHIARVTSLPH